MYIPISLGTVNKFLAEQELRQYLKRIGAGYEHRQEEFYLAYLHQQHLLAVPFENFDVLLRKPIKPDIHELFDKIVIRKRGGICYELNYLFSWLLQNTFYNVTLLSAIVFTRSENIYPNIFDIVNGTENYDLNNFFDEFTKWLIGIETEKFSHLCLLVNTRDTAYLCDVGFGDGFSFPLKFDGEIQIQKNGAWRILKNEDEYILQKLFDYKLFCEKFFPIKYYNSQISYHLKNDNQKHKIEGGYQEIAEKLFMLISGKFGNRIWLPIYKFTLKPHKIEDFAERCNYYTTNVNSSFTKKSMIKIFTENGSASMINNEITIKKNDFETVAKELDMQKFKYYLEHIFDFLPSEIENIANNIYGSARA